MSLQNTLLYRLMLITGVALALSACNAPAATESSAIVPSPKMDAPHTTVSGSRKAVFAGGCFWGMQWVFEHVRGVQKVTSGYAGGKAATALYDVVSRGTTGHAESIRVQYDPSQVSYGQLLRVYFAVATNPTELDRQGPDVGTQYRSVIFYADAQQRKIAAAYIAQLTAAHVYDAAIVTRLAPLHGFYPAESYHQDYARLHPHAPYIAINDAPKLRHLQQRLPSLYSASGGDYTP